MLLVIDVGNTNTVLGVHDGEELKAHWRLTTRREQTADEWGVFIQTLLGTRGIAQGDITGVAISNVVPPIQQALEWMCERYFGVNPLTVEPGVTADLPLNVDTPREVGADRIVSCVAAIALYGTPLIVVDFGTATRFDCVNSRGEFIGGAIAPGGFLVYTCQPWHPQLELIARALKSHRGGEAWVMRRRTQAEMDQLVERAGFRKVAQRINEDGLFTVSLAERRTQ